MEKEEHFYHELDTHGKRRSFCSCQTLLILFVGIAIIVALIITTVVKKVATVITPKRHVTATSADADTLQQKLTDLRNAPGASTSLVITEQELTGLLISGVNSQPDVPLRDVQAEINPDAVTVTGTLTEYFKSSVSISLLPKVTSGKLGFEITKLQAGSFAVPSYVTQKLAQQFDTLLNQQSSELQGITVKSVQLGAGQMTVTGVIADPGTEAATENPS